MFGVSYYFYRKITKNNKENIYLYNLVFFCTLLQLLVVRSYILARLTTYLYIYYVLLIPPLLNEFLKKQLDVNLKDVDDLSNLYISYEPIWSIGSNPPSNDEIEDVVKYIKSLFKEDVRVLYGGGVNEKNITELNKIPDINGYLIGGASTIPEKFIKIIEVTK